MVLHLFERIFGTYGDPKGKFRGDSTLEHYIEAGFSETEAKSLAWFNRKENRGKFFGLLGGFWVLYVGRPWWQSLRRFSPRFLYQPIWNPVLKVAVLYGCYCLGDYIATSPIRRGAEDQISTLYNNNAFLKTREAFIQTFEPLNRKFTQEEIGQFYVRQYKNAGIERKWNYNPHIHGDQDQFNKVVREALSGVPAYQDPAVKAKINQENRSKIEAGEIVIDKPYKLEDIIDARGEKQGIQSIPWFSGWRPLH